MAEITTPSSTKNQTNVEFENEGYDEDCENLTQESKELILSLPREKGWISPYLYLYKDVWVPALQVQAICSLQKNFQAIDDDIVIASTMKSGTAWLKGLVFAIVNRKVFSPSQKTILCLCRIRMCLFSPLSSTILEITKFLTYPIYLNQEYLVPIFHFIYCPIQLPNPNAR